MYAINKGGQYDDSYRYSLGLVPITREELAKLVRQYEEINQVHVEIIEIPIDMSNIYSYYALFTIVGFVLLFTHLTRTFFPLRI